MKFFSYGIISSALFIFFISGGINSFLFTVIFFLILNNNLLILEEKNIQIYNLFLNFCYFILSLRANFFNLSYFLIFFLHLQIITHKINALFILVLNIFFFIDFNYLNLILLILSTSSFLSCKLKTKKKWNNRSAFYIKLFCIINLVHSTKRIWIHWIMDCIY